MKTDMVATCKANIETVESGEATSEQVLAAMDFVVTLAFVTNELKKRMEEAAIKWIQANGDLVDGDIRYYVGPNKSTKCLDLPGTLRALLEVSGGDLDAVVEVLSSGAFKPAKAKEVLGERADGLFETKETTDLKTGKATGPRLQKSDPRFIR
jgi:ABC-type glycerol-3-phosphate transport system substrate-binding protein